MPLSAPLRNFGIYFWFSATSFYHGAALLTLAYFALSRASPYGAYIFWAALLPYMAILATSKTPHNLKAI